MPLTDPYSSGGATVRPYPVGSGRMGPPTNPANSPGGQMLQVYAGYNSPTQTYLTQQRQSLGTQLDLSNYGYGLQQQALNQQYGFDTRDLGLQQQALGVDQNSVPRQIDYYNALYGTDADKYRNNVGYQNTLRGLSTEGYGTTLHDLANQASQARWQAEVNQRGLRSDLTGAGSFTSAGGREKRKDINSARDYALSGIGISKAKAGQQYRQEQAGIANTIANLTSDFKAAGLTKDEQIARLNDRRATLNVQAQQLGLQGDELAAKLQQGLATLGLNHATSVGQILDALNSNDYQQRQFAMNLVAAANGMG